MYSILLASILMILVVDRCSNFRLDDPIQSKRISDLCAEAEKANSGLLKSRRGKRCAPNGVAASNDAISVVTGDAVTLATDFIHKIDDDDPVSMVTDKVNREAISKVDDGVVLKKDATNEVSANDASLKVVANDIRPKVEDGVIIKSGDDGISVVTDDVMPMFDHDIPNDRDTVAMTTDDVIPDDVEPKVKEDAIFKVADDAIPKVEDDAVAMGTDDVISTFKKSDEVVSTSTQRVKADAYDCDSRNPCTPDNLEAGHYYYANDSVDKFVQCTELGLCVVMDCPAGTVWISAADTCGPEFM